MTAPTRGRTRGVGGLVRLLCVLLLACAWLQAAAAVQVIRTAESVVTLDDGLTFSGPVQLPYNWDRRHPGHGGTGRFRIVLPPLETDDSLLALHFSRLGNAYEILLDGRLVDRKGDLDRPDSSNHALLPQRVTIPSGLLGTARILEVRIRADVMRRAGVPEVVAGPLHDIEPIHARALRWRVDGSLVVAIFSLLVGAVAFALFLSQRPGSPERDPLFLYAGLAEACWAFRVGIVLIPEPPLPWPLWNALNVMALCAWAWFMLGFCIVVGEWTQRPWARPVLRGFALLVVGGGVAGYGAVAWGMPRLVTLSYASLATVIVPFCIYYAIDAVRRPGRIKGIVAATVALNVIVGLRDFVSFRVTDAFGVDMMMRYSSVLFGTTLLAIVVARFRSASEQSRRLAATLAEEVALKEAELRRSFESIERLAREQARVEERARVLRDLHDGVGAHLSSALRQVQRSEPSQQALHRTLTDALDEMKLSVDSMYLVPGDITGLLAAMRYRLEPRLVSAGIVLAWNVEAVEPLERMDAHALRQVQLVVYAALSNVLQHAKATRLEIACREQDGCVELRIEDDGIGFDASLSSSRGLQWMRDRAASIAGRCDVSATGFGTVVMLRLPRARSLPR